MALDSLKKSNIEFVLFDEVAVEPTDLSYQESTRFAIAAKVDGFISVGGGSVMVRSSRLDIYLDGWLI